MFCGYYLPMEWGYRGGEDEGRQSLQEIQHLLSGGLGQSGTVDPRHLDTLHMVPAQLRHPIEHNLPELVAALHIVGGPTPRELALAPFRTQFVKEKVENRLKCLFVG